MDEQTRAKYRAWMIKKLLRKLVIPAALLLLVFILLIVSIRSCTRRDDEIDEYDLPCELYDGDGECLEVDENGDDQTVFAPNRRLTYQDFDFTTYNDSAIVEVEDLGTYLIIANKVFKLPANYEPHDLTVPQVTSVWGQENLTLQMRASASRALEALFAEASEDAGLELWAVSGFRSYEDQRTRHQHFIDTHGVEQAQAMSARAGHSEHQTGLSMDISAESVGGLLTEDFTNQPEGVWLRENAHRFGFIIRYPYSRMNITGISYEPWHIRYVGQEAAIAIRANNLVLEQYVLPAVLWDQP